MAGKRVMVLLVVLALLATQSGCWSRKEIEDLAIGTALGIDRVEVGGRPKWRVAIQIVRPGEMGAGGGQRGGGGQGKPVLLASSLGDTLEDAIINMKTRSPRQLFLAHANLIVLGERVAREGAHEVVDIILRERDLRLRVWVLVTKGEALDILRAEPELEKLPSEEMMGLITNTQPKVSKAFVVDVKDFINQLAAPGRDAVASKVQVFTPMEERPTGGGEPQAPRGMEKEVKPAVRLTGAAVFRGDRLAGWMGDRETKGYLYVINEAEGGIIPVRIHGHQEKDISFMMTRSKSKITPEVRDGRIAFSVEIKAEGDLGEHQETLQIAKPGTIKSLEKDVTQEIKKMVEESIRMAQQDFGADIFGFGERLHKKYPKVWKEIEKDWRDIYPAVEVTVSVEAKIRRTGMIGDSPVIK